MKILVNTIPWNFVPLITQMDKWLEWFHFDEGCDVILVADVSDDRDFVSVECRESTKQDAAYHALQVATQLAAEGYTLRAAGMHSRALRFDACMDIHPSIYQPNPPIHDLHMVPMQSIPVHK
jgi:hypothetical protein